VGGEELYGLQERGEREAVGKTRRAPGRVMGIVVFFWLLFELGFI
jgi:hypothetical protein